MIGTPIRYTVGNYKYRLASDWSVQSGIVGAAAKIDDQDDITRPWVWLDQDGLLRIREGYCWDGPSGPTIDSRSSMRASLAHDALYQLERAGHLGQEWRMAADELLCRLCIADGMWPIRARLWLWGVRTFAGYAAKRQAETILVAP